MRREVKKDGTTVLAGLGLSDILLAVHPVGCIYFSIQNVNPGTIFGGTWVAWGSGRVPVGVDAAQTEFDTVEETGGEKTHVLTVTEMPTHSHGNVWSEDLGAADWQIANGTGVAFKRHAPTANAGGGGAHNNLQPYITCYMWKRTA